MTIVPPLSYTVVDNDPVAWGRGVGYVFRKRLKTFNKKWKARLYVWWQRCNDDRYFAYYTVETGDIPDTEWRTPTGERWLKKNGEPHD